jgi:hypothetical protein
MCSTLRLGAYPAFLALTSELTLCPIHEIHVMWEEQ